MKRLILMRHAKSSTADPGQPDHDRPLDERGKQAARRMGEWLRARGYRPDRALVSTAARAQQTWTCLAEALDQPPMEPRPEIYHAAPARMLALLQAAEDAGCLMLIGHQPGIGTLVGDLLRTPEPKIDPARYPTAALNVLDFEIGAWANLGWRTGRLTVHIRPRDLA